MKKLCLALVLLPALLLAACSREGSRAGRMPRRRRFRTLCPP